MTDKAPSFFARHRTKLVASIVLGVGLVLTLERGGLHLLPARETFAHVKWWTVPLYMVTLAVNTWFRAGRWRYLLRPIAPVPTRRVIEVVMIGLAAIVVLPFRIGEMVRPYLVRKKDLPMTAALSTVVAERIVDGLYLSLVLAAALLFVPTIQPLPERVIGLPISVAQVRVYGYALLAVFGSAFTVIAVFYAARDFARAATLKVVGVVSRPLAEKLAGMAGNLADGLRFLGRARDALPFLLETTLYWLVNVLGMWLLAWGCGVVHADGSAATFPEMCAVLGMLGATIVLPGPPGLLGVFQAGIYAGMTMYYPTAIVTGPGAAYTFLLYACQFVFYVGAGGVVLLVHEEDRGKVFEADRATPEAT